MENIEIAKVCGLCAGCKRAINTAEEELNKGKKVTIFKEIVHNKNVNNSLISKGAVFAENLEDLKNAETVIIRAHGEPPETYDFLNANNISFKDCTCPRVEKIHEEVKRYVGDGYFIIILGKFHKALHPEVLGTLGYANGRAILVENEDDFARVETLKNEKVYLVCQTTFNLKKADELIEIIEMILSKNNCHLVVNKSICDAQKFINLSSAELASQVDTMIVVGGKNSSNSLELYKNMSSICPSIFIENINEYKQAFAEIGITLSKDLKIGITAGASTNKAELEELKQLIKKDLEEI